VSWVSLALLALAIVVLVGAEWPRLETRFGREARRRRERTRRKASLKLLRGAAPEDPDDALRAESEKFVASVERDLSQLPTIEENDRRR
jgi:hypothetical protein